MAARNMAGWRREVLARYGSVCAARDDGECSGPLEAHHIIYRSQGGREDPENGLMLCTRHHGRVHSRQVLIGSDWLWQDQRDYLAGREWVAWDWIGQPYGRGYKGFAALQS